MDGLLWSATRLPAAEWRQDVRTEAVLLTPRLGKLLADTKRVEAVHADHPAQTLELRLWHEKFSPNRRSAVTLPVAVLDVKSAAVAAEQDSPCLASAIICAYLWPHTVAA